MVNALYEKGDTAAAIDSLKKALNINPNYAEIYSNMGLLLAEIGQLSAATENCNKILVPIGPFIDCSKAFKRPSVSFEMPLEGCFHASVPIGVTVKQSYCS